jgi:hypothetical protein
LADVVEANNIVAREDIMTVVDAGTPTAVENLPPPPPGMAAIGTDALIAMTTDTTTG